MKKNYTLMLAMAFLSFAFVSCQKIGVDELSQVNNTPQVKKATTGEVINNTTENAGCEATVVSLIAGQHINAGTVTVTNDDEFVYVTYTTTGNWVLSETHLYVGDCNAIPVNNSGNPRIGQFPYKATHADLTTYTYQVPINALNSCGCIAAHAVVKQAGQSGSETAWGNGTPINPGGSWAMRFAYCICIELAT